MRLNYYRFPDGTDESVLLANGCAIITKDGGEVYADSIPDDKRGLVDHIITTIYAGSVTNAKRLLKEFGGSAWTEHCERDGGLFEVTEIKLTKTSWFGKPAKWDLRNWTDGIPKSGVVIGSDESLTKLRDLLIQICKGIAESDYEEF